MKYFRTIFVFVIGIFTALSVLMLNSCEENTLDHNIRDYEISDEIILGKFLLRELLKDQENWPVLKNDRIQETLHLSYEATWSHPRINYSKDFLYNFIVINKDEVFIFSLPGANFVISLGLLKTIEDESTLFALISSEVCKSNERIVTKKMLKEYTIYDLITLSIDTTSYESKKLAERVVKNFDFLKSNLEDEYYLDSLSFYLSYSNEHNAYGMKNFLEITKKNLNSDKYKKQLALHPFSDKRIERLNAFMEKEKVLPPTKLNTYYEFYQTFKKLLP